jgi:hypothetical protein
VSCPDCGTKTGADWRFCAPCLVKRMGKVSDAQERAEERRDTLDHDEEGQAVGLDCD